MEDFIKTNVFCQFYHFPCELFCLFPDFQFSIRGHIDNIREDLNKPVHLLKNFDCRNESKHFF